MWTIILGFIRKIIGGKTNTGILIWILGTAVYISPWLPTFTFEVWWKFTTLIGAWTGASFLERIEKYKSVWKALKGMLDDIVWVKVKSEKGKELNP